MARAVPTTLAARSNGGLTVAAIARLTPWVGSYERVFDASMTGVVLNSASVLGGEFLMQRYSTTDVLCLNRYGADGSTYSISYDGLLMGSSKEQGGMRSLRSDSGDWAFVVFVTTANATSSVTDVYSNGAFTSRSTNTNDRAGAANDPLHDRVFPATNASAVTAAAGAFFQLGRSHWPPDHLLTGSISALLVWDRPLPPDQLEALHDAMAPRSAGRVPAPFAHFDGGYSFLQLPASTTFASIEMWVRLAPPAAQQPARTQATHGCSSAAAGAHGRPTAATRDGQGPQNAMMDRCAPLDQVAGDITAQV
jgi:hypothetical protein